MTRHAFQYPSTLGHFSKLYATPPIVREIKRHTINSVEDFAIERFCNAPRAFLNQPATASQPEASEKSPLAAPPWYASGAAATRPLDVAGVQSGATEVIQFSPFGLKSNQAQASASPVAQNSSSPILPLALMVC